MVFIEIIGIPNWRRGGHRESLLNSIICDTTEMAGKATRSKEKGSFGST